MNSKTRVEETFSEFYEKWVCQLEEYLLLLLKASKEKTSHDSHYEALVDELTAHHKSYYNAKWTAAQKDVMAFFSQVWLSPPENAHLWFTGWNPSMVFQLVDSLIQNRVPGVSLSGLSNEQVKAIEKLRVKIRSDKAKVESDMERVQVALADHPMMQLVRRADGFVKAVRKLVGESERVMRMADCVRLKTLKIVLDVFKPRQRVEFLSAMSMVQLKLRKWGRERENIHHA